MVKSSPEEAKRLQKAKDDVLSVIVGPRALTQKEIDKLESTGADVKAFLVEREKAHRQKQLKMAAMFVQGLMTRSVLKQTAAKLAKYEADENAENSEFDAVHKATKKGKGTTPEPKPRRSPLASLGIDEDD